MSPLMICVMMLAIWSAPDLGERTRRFNAGFWTIGIIVCLGFEVYKWSTT